MLFSFFERAACVALLLLVVSARADGWTGQGSVYIPNMQFGTQMAQLATDGTNLYYSTLVDGVYRSALPQLNFSEMPLTGFPLWDPVTNTNGFAVQNLAVAPLGTVLISGTPVNISANGISPPPGSFNNLLPVFYWWDETNQVWHPAVVTGKAYPYTASVGNFSSAPDGSVWACSGYSPYAYRSTDDGHSYTAFNIDSRVPANYFPIPLNPSLQTVGKVFSLVAGPAGEVVIGTEAGGLLHTTNNGQSWASLDPNFTNPNSQNPLGRIGDAQVTGLDHYGNFLCGNYQLSQFPGYTNWSGIRLIGWHPADGSYFNAASGFQGNYGPARILTPPSGVSFTFMNQGSNQLGGVYLSPDGKNWSQFNQNLPVVSANVGSLLAAGNCITAAGNQIFIGIGNIFYQYDSTPPPITNRPPVAFGQNFNLLENTPTNFMLTGYDADGDAVNFTVLTWPQHGSLTGLPPEVTYTPSNNVASADQLLFQVDDGLATSAPVVIHFSINAPTNPPPTIVFTTSLRQNWVVGPTNITLSASASDLGGLQQVNFYNGTNFLGPITKPPYVFILTNLPPGDYTLNAMAVSSQEARTWARPVGISVFSANPTLGIRPVDALNIAVTWPLALDGFYVESAPAANGPWTLSPFPPEYSASGQTAIIPFTDQQVFRLMHP